MPLPTLLPLLVLACTGDDACPLPLSDYCGKSCGDLDHYREQCADAHPETGAGGCEETDCGSYTRLIGSGQWAGESWYFDADGGLVGYEYVWEGDGPGNCGDTGMFYGWNEYGTVPDC